MLIFHIKRFRTLCNINIINLKINEETKDTFIE